MNPDDFNIDPKLLEELEDTFDRVVSDTENGYSIELIMSRAVARDIVANWIKAMMGHSDAVATCFYEYSQIVSSIMQALKEDGD